METTEALRKFLPRCQCHKQVHADRIAGIEPNASPITHGTVLILDRCRVTVPPSFIEKHSPAVGGYLVVYEDGYQSYSPAKAFEEGYNRI